MPERYPEEFRRKVLDLVAAGRPVAQIAADLGTVTRPSMVGAIRSSIDTGQLGKLDRGEPSELTATATDRAELRLHGNFPPPATPPLSPRHEDPD